MILQLHLSSVFSAIPFRSMFINKGFLVFQSVSTFVLRHAIYIYIYIYIYILIKIFDNLIQVSDITFYPIILPLSWVTLKYGNADVHTKTSNY